jgi:hypothetical protein
MMNSYDLTMWMIAQARHQELLAEAERLRMIQAFQENKKATPWRRLRWQAGRLMIAAGRKLQTQVEPRQMVHNS